MDAPAIIRALTRLAPAVPAALLLGACATSPPLAGPTRNQIIISVRDQRLTVITADQRRVTFPISTSKFGLGDRRGSLATPTGEMEVAQKIGDGAAPGSVFHGRVRTGEIVKVDSPGRDAIVTRILALKGLEASNREAYSRGIYIHGTPEERNIGRPVSYGCIRMRSSDVIQLYNMVKVGARVEIIDTTMNKAIASNILEPPPTPVVVTTPPAAAPGAGAAPGGAAGGAGPHLVAESAPPVKAPEKKTDAPAKKEWAGAPSKLLAKQAAMEAKNKNFKPAGATRPVSNDGETTRELNHSALDSL